MRAIALSLDRSASSISRELARNGWCDPRSQPARAGRSALAGGYRAPTAHQRAALNRSRGRKPARLAEDGFLWSQVQKLLRQRYSPEQIAGILPRMFPDDSSMRASHETIYTALYAMPRGELRTECLPPCGKVVKFVVHAHAVRIAVARFLIWSAFTSGRQRWMSA